MTRRTTSVNSPKRRGKRILAVIALISVVVAVVVAVRSRRLPELTQARFDAACARWKQHAPDSYEIEVKVTGMQPGVYGVVVDNKLPTSATFDGRPLTRPRTFGTWAVTGMFDTLAKDLETNAANGYLMLGAELDEATGIPLRYERIEVRTGAHQALKWVVTKFEAR